MTGYRVARGYELPEDTPRIVLGAAVDTGDVVQIAASALTRHGVVAGATGAGKTGTVRHIVTECSALGIPTLAVDGKGDMSGLAALGALNDTLAARVASLGQDWHPTAVPVEFLAPGGMGVGLPVHIPVDALEPEMLLRMLNLTERQGVALDVACRMAKRAGRRIITLAEMEKVLTGMRDAGTSPTSEMTVNRAITCVQSFADKCGELFGSPAFDVTDLLRTTDDGWGVVSLIDGMQFATIEKSGILTTFLLSILRTLAGSDSPLPEIGDDQIPRLVIFIGEAHRVFADASKAFINVIVDSVRILRSRGVAVFFETQNISDIPEPVLEQCGSRVQHRMNAYTPNQVKALRMTARTFPQGDCDIASALRMMPKGTGLVTFISDDGAPSPTVETAIYTPRTLMGPLPAEVRQRMTDGSELRGKYRTLEHAEATARVVAAPDARTRTVGTVEAPPVSRTRAAAPEAPRTRATASTARVPPRKPRGPVKSV